MLMTAKMIYAKETVARLVAARLTKAKGVEYVFDKIATGFQVRPATGAVAPNATPSTAEKTGPYTTVKLAPLAAPAKPVKKGTLTIKPKGPPSMSPLLAAHVNAGHIAYFQADPTEGMVLILHMPFKRESKGFVEGYVNGQIMSFGKSTLLSWAVGQAATICMSVAQAKKRGLAI